MYTVVNYKVCKIDLYLFKNSLMKKKQTSCVYFKYLVQNEFTIVLFYELSAVPAPVAFSSSHLSIHSE